VSPFGRLVGSKPPNGGLLPTEGEGVLADGLLVGLGRGARVRSDPTGELVSGDSHWMPEHAPSVALRRTHPK